MTDPCPEAFMIWEDKCTLLDKKCVKNPINCITCEVYKKFEDEVINTGGI